MGGIFFGKFERVSIKKNSDIYVTERRRTRKKMAFVHRVCRLPLRSLSWSRSVAGQRFYSTGTTAGEGNTSIVKKSEGEAVAEYVAPDQLVS